MKDKIVLKFEIESNLTDTKDTMRICNEVATYVQAFKGAQLTNVGVEYGWNPEQKVKQSDEFLKANPDWDKPKSGWQKAKEKLFNKYEEKVTGKITEQEFKEYVDNPNK